MVAVVARHAEKSELFSAGGRAHPTNERNKLENPTSSDIQPVVRLLQTGCRTYCFTCPSSDPLRSGSATRQACSLEIVER